MPYLFEVLAYVALALLQKEISYVSRGHAQPGDVNYPAAFGGPKAFNGRQVAELCFNSLDEGGVKALDVSCLLRGGLHFVPTSTARGASPALNLRLHPPSHLHSYLTHLLEGSTPSQQLIPNGRLITRDAAPQRQEAFVTPAEHLEEPRSWVRVDVGGHSRQESRM